MAKVKDLVDLGEVESLRQAPQVSALKNTLMLGIVAIWFSFGQSMDKKIMYYSLDAYCLIN